MVAAVHGFFASAGQVAARMTRGWPETARPSALSAIGWPSRSLISPAHRGQRLGQQPLVHGVLGVGGAGHHLQLDDAGAEQGEHGEQDAQAEPQAASRAGQGRAGTAGRAGARAARDRAGAAGALPRGRSPRSGSPGRPGGRGAGAARVPALGGTVLAARRRGRWPWRGGAGPRGRAGPRRRAWPSAPSWAAVAGGGGRAPRTGRRPASRRRRAGPASAAAGSGRRGAGLRVAEDGAVGQLQEHRRAGRDHALRLGLAASAAGACRASTSPCSTCSRSASCLLDTCSACRWNEPCARRVFRPSSPSRPDGEHGHDDRRRRARGRPAAGRWAPRAAGRASGQRRPGAGCRGRRPAVRAGRASGARVGPRGGRCGPALGAGGPGGAPLTRRPGRARPRAAGPRRPAGWRRPPASDACSDAAHQQAQLGRAALGDERQVHRHVARGARDQLGLHDLVLQGLVAQDDDPSAHG